MAILKMPKGTRRAKREIENKILPAVHPNIGIEIEYRRKLESLIDEMHKSIRYWVLAAYRSDIPDTSIMMASDDSSAVMLSKVMRSLRRRWDRRFKKESMRLAKYFATAAIERADGSLERALKRSGLAIKFNLNAAANDVLQSTINANVALITNMPQKSLSDIEGLVMRSVQAGRDIGGLAKELDAYFPKDKKRARLIARDQNNKATASIVRTRQAELGITQAKWLHSHGGKEPRPSHVAMNGKTYDVKEGMWDPDANGKGKGAYIFPGELINCRCASRSIVPGITRTS